MSEHVQAQGKLRPMRQGIVHPCIVDVIPPSSLLQSTSSLDFMYPTSTSVSTSTPSSTLTSTNSITPDLETKIKSKHVSFSDSEVTQMSERVELLHLKDDIKANAIQLLMAVNVRDSCQATEQQIVLGSPIRGQANDKGKAMSRYRL